MNKVLIIYNSKTGNTKYYAKFLAKELKADCIPFFEVTPSIIDRYSTIIFGSRLQAGIILGLKKMKKLLKRSSVKNFILFTTGASPMKEEGIEKLWQNNLSRDEIKAFAYFYLPAGLNYEAMGVVDRAMMKVFSFALGLKKNPTEEEIAQREMVKQSYDLKDKKLIQPIVDKVYGLDD